MKSDYVQAFLATLADGMTVEAALSGLRAALQRKGHSKLLPSVLQEVLRTLEAQKESVGAVVTVARPSDLQMHKSKIETIIHELGASNVEIKEEVDETIVGGFVATFNYKENDQSYKKALKSLYESIIK
jgi:F0F1-type ATP synthase delta subunit